MSLVVRWIACTVAIGAASFVVQGFAVGMNASSWIAIALLGLVLAVMDKALEQSVQNMNPPASTAALGAIYLVVNVVALRLASWLVDGLFGITIVFLGLGSVLAAGLIVSLVALVLYIAIMARGSKAE